MLSRDEFETICGRLTRLSFGDELVLVGSSVMFRLSRQLPPMTEDVDVAVPEELLVQNEAAVRSSLVAQGFRQVEGTATWLDAEGRSLDLLAFTGSDTPDRPGGTPTLVAMVFSDLCRILRDPRGRDRTGPGPCHLSAGGLILSKLLTLRIEKGPKDRLHALLLLAEQRNDPRLGEALTGLASRFAAEALEDVLPEAQAALIALGHPSPSGSLWVEEYASRAEQVREGLAWLQRIVGLWSWC